MNDTELLNGLRDRFGPTIVRMYELVDLGSHATGWDSVYIDEERSDIEADLANEFALLLFPEQEE